MSIHPTAIIDGEVQIGQNVVISPYVVISGPCVIGDGTYIAPFVSVGGPAEHGSQKFEFRPKTYAGKLIIVGNACVIREGVTINKPMNDKTVVGDRCVLMARSHVSHDCILEDDVILATNAQLGGHTRMMNGSYAGLCAVTHQWTTCGNYSIIAANATLVKDLPCWAKYIPSKPLRINEYALKKYGVNVNSAEYAAQNERWESVRNKGREKLQFDAISPYLEQAQAAWELTAEKKFTLKEEE